MPEAKIGIYVGVKAEIERERRLRTELSNTGKHSRGGKTKQENEIKQVRSGREKGRPIQGESFEGSQARRFCHGQSTWV